jgi:hypothetical protein
LNVFLKKSLCSSWCELCALCSGYVPMPPWRAWWWACGSTRWSCRPSGAWDEKSVGGNGANTSTEGITADLYRSASTRTRLVAGSDRCQRAHSTSCVVVMAWIYASWWYILSTLSAVSRGEALKGLAVAASVWHPSWLAGGSTSLARALVEANSTIKILSTLSAGSCHGGVCDGTVVAACLPVSLLRRGDASGSTLVCRARACTCHPP